jgi:hypothetical protein
MADILGWVENPFLLPKNSKIEFFKKSSHVVLKFCRRAFLKFFQVDGANQDGGTIQDGEFLTIYYKKFGKNL